MISIDFTNPRLSHCRAFMYPIGCGDALGWRNLSPLWIIPVQNGLDHATDWGSVYGGHPSLLTGSSSPGLGTTAAFYSYWNDIWPDDAGKDFTIIARTTYRGTSPGSGGGAFVAGARGSGSNGGFLYGVWNDGTNSGMAIFLYSTSGTWIFPDGVGFTEVIDRPMVSAAVYQSGEQRLTMYRDGVMTRTATNTASVWNPYVNQAGKQLTIGRADAGFIWPGEIGWVMIFARALSREEIVHLSRDAEWDFAWDDAQFLLAPASHTFTTTVYQSDIYTISGGNGARYDSGVDCSAVLDGDLIAGPQPPATATYTTAVTVASTMFGSVPTLVVYHTEVTVGQSYSNSAPVQYTTTVTISSHARGLIDGRADLIGTARYRR